MTRMPWTLTALLFTTIAVPARADENEKPRPAPRPVAQSVVKITCSGRQIHPLRPWLKVGDQEQTGSGVVIDGKRILTNAHVVAHTREVFIQPNQSAEKVPASVKVIAPDIDLAILTVDDDAFFEKYPPLARSSALPRIKDTVHVHGYPVGGEELSITRGIVSRIEYVQYYYVTMGLRIQVDAAINAGNSGGPALLGDEMVGIIFSRLEESDNIGYIIPNEEIEHFLHDVADGRYDGKPALYDVGQYAQNEMLRRWMHLEKGVEGMLVTRPDKETPNNPLRPWDIITKIGDYPIDGAGMVRATPDLRVNFRYLVQKLVKNDMVPLEIVREGKPLHIDMPAVPAAARPRLVPFLFDKAPSYLVWGPLVFSTATYEYLAAFEQTGMAEQWFPFLLHNASPLVARAVDPPKFEGEELVVAVALLPHRLAKGYSDPISCVVSEVDGVKVRNLRHFAELLRDARGEFVTIHFFDRSADTFVFDRKKVADAMDEILSDNGIRSAYSDDLKPVFQAK